MRVHSGTSGTANRQTHPPPSWAITQGSVEVFLTESPWTLCQKSDELFPAVKFLPATSDDVGREVERQPWGTFAALNTNRSADPSSGWTQL